MKTAYKFLTLTLVTLSLFHDPKAAHAVPAFSRQTGQECATCHVGSFGPQLTSFGRTFKMNGYTMSNGEDKKLMQYISGMVIASHEHTKKDLPAGSTDLNANNNLAADQVSLFVAGGLTDHLGIFSQATYSGPADAASWDNVDLRYANDTTFKGKDLVYGITANNNPSAQDVWQTAPAWQFPYASSEIAPTPDAGAFMTGLGQTVAGLGVYGLWDQMLYAELSGYSSLSNNVQRTLGVLGSDTADHIDGIAPYWRLALQHDTGTQYYSIGTFGMNSKRYPGNDRTMGTDKMLDLALDATYQYTEGDNIFSLYASYMHERQNLDATFALGASTNGTNTLNSFNANASYYYKNTYGVTLGRFSTTGSADALLYPDADNNRPDSAGWTIQFDATPFGREGAFAYPNFNARFFIQYTAYDKFNGLGHNYDGTGRDASDNNLLYTGIWFAF